MTLLTFLIGVSISLNSIAQDVHFSQFQNTPLLQNASFAGKVDGDFRAIVNYRSQWANVTSNPYQSFGANIDMRFNNQFDGVGHNPALSSHEDLKNTSEISPPISGGISYMWSNFFGKNTTRTNNGKKKINVGLAVHHYNASSLLLCRSRRFRIKIYSKF